MADSGISVWDRRRVGRLTSRDKLAECEGGCGAQLRWSPEGTWLATAARLLSVGRQLHEVVLTERFNAPGTQTTVVWSSDSTKLALVNGPSVRVFSVPSGRMQVHIDGSFDSGTERYFKVGRRQPTWFSDKGVLLLVPPWSDSLLELYRVSDGRSVWATVVRAHEKPSRLVFTSDGFYSGARSAFDGVARTVSHAVFAGMTASPQQRPSLLSDFLAGKPID
jgi:hypothetical protein